MLKIQALVNLLINYINNENENRRYKNKIEEYQNNAIRESFSHYQPSLNFINLLFKDNKSYTEKYNNGIKEFSPNNVMNLKKEKRSDGRSINSRFFHQKKSDYPPVFMSYDSKVPGYINEKERFEINKMDSSFELIGCTSIKSLIFSVTSSSDIVLSMC